MVVFDVVVVSSVEASAMIPAEVPIVETAHRVDFTATSFFVLTPTIEVIATAAVLVVVVVASAAFVNIVELPTFYVQAMPAALTEVLCYRL